MDTQEINLIPADQALDSQRDEGLPRSAEEKNALLERQYNDGLDTAAKNSLLEIGINPDDNGRFSPETFTFVRRILKERTTPSKRGKQYLASDSHSKRIANLMYPSIKTEDPKTKKRYDNFVTNERIILEEGHPNKKIIEIHYGAGETDKDLEFIDQIISDPESFVKETLGINRRIGEPLELSLNLRYPADIPQNENVLREIKEKIEENSKDKFKISLDLSVKNLPFTTEQIKKLDGVIDKHKKEVGRHPSEQYLEIREASVRNVVENILSELPETSTLSKLIKMDSDFVIKQIYESVKNYKGGNLEEAMGYVFEAAVAIEMRDNVFDDQMSELIWGAMNANKSAKGGILDLTSSDFRTLNSEYQKYMSAHWLGHGDFVIDEKIAGIPTVTAIIECKVSPNEHMQDSVRGQILNELANVQKFIDKHSETGKGELRTLSEKDLRVIVIRPLPAGKDNIPKNRMVGSEILGSSVVTTIRSAISTEDMNIVRKYMGGIEPAA